MRGRRPKTHNQAVFYQEIGENIRYFRQQVGMTQNELALKIGLSRPALVNIEQGRQEIRLHAAVLIAQSLQCPLMDLLETTTKLKRVIRLVV